MKHKLRQTKETLNALGTSRYGKVVIIGTALASAAAARADDPLTGFVTSLTTEAGTLGTTLATVAGAALPLFALFYGVRAAVRMFKVIK